MSSFDQDIARAKKQLADMDARIGRNLPEIAKAGAAVLLEGAKELAPVKTGKLKKSLKLRAGKRRPTSAEHLVVSDVFYAPFVEFGTSKRSARPFLRPAADTRHGEITAAMTKAALDGDGL